MDFNLKSIVCLLILLVSVETAFGDENKALEYLERNNLTLHDVVVSVHEFNYKLVYGIVKKLGHNPHSLLHEIYPEAAKLVNASFDLISQCYDTSIGRSEMDIFHEPIGQIVLEFFHAYVERLDITGMKEYVQRVKTLLHTLRELAKHVLECVLNVHDDDYEPTKLGLTQFSAYTHEQFVDMVSNKQMNEDEDEVALGDANPFERAMRSKPFREEGPEGVEPWPNPIPKYADRPRCAITDNEIDELSKVKEIDWRGRGYVSPVKDQGQCTSCYIFAATGAMESAYMRKFDTYVEFNEQIFLNCYSESSCKKGSVPRKIYEYAKDHGIVLDQDGDDYIASIHQNECKKRKPIFAYPTNYCEFNPGIKPQMNKASQLEAMIVKYGPVAVSIKAYTPTFQNLRGPWNMKCIGDVGYNLTKEEIKTFGPEYNVDHAVLAVGFNEKYWIIKNSWNASWGQDGYLMLRKRGDENNCGILTSAYVPLFGEPMSSKPKLEELTENQNPSPSTPNPEDPTDNQKPSSSKPKPAESTKNPNENFSTPKATKPPRKEKPTKKNRGPK